MSFHVTFNQHNTQLVVANVYQFPFHQFDPEAAFTLSIDPRDNVTPLTDQIAYYKQFPKMLDYWTMRVKQQLDTRGGYFKETHHVEMCRSTQIGTRICSVACPKIHHYPVYRALGGAPLETKKPKAAPPEMPDLKAKAKDRELSRQPIMPFAPKPLIIDEYVPQPIEKLNKDSEPL